MRDVVVDLMAAASDPCRHRFALQAGRSRRTHASRSRRWLARHTVRLVHLRHGASQVSQRASARGHSKLLLRQGLVTGGRLLEHKRNHLGASSGSKLTLLLSRQQGCAVLVLARIVVHLVLRSDYRRPQLLVVALGVMRRLEVMMPVVSDVERRLRHDMMLLVAWRPWVVERVLRTAQCLVGAMTLGSMQMTRGDIVEGL